MRFRYARRTLRILKQLSMRGTTWPESCAQAVEQLILALEKKIEKSGDSSAQRASTSLSLVGNRNGRTGDSTVQTRPSVHRYGGTRSTNRRLGMATDHGTYSTDTPSQSHGL